MTEHACIHAHAGARVHTHTHTHSAQFVQRPEKTFQTQIRAEKPGGEQTGVSF